jgi:pSer/pThr/pTyr-binding forkhead associated (FHA) protein
MITLQICPNCRFQNPSDAVRCSQCGTLLMDKGIETARLKDLASDFQSPEPSSGIELRPGMLALYIMGEKNPILLDGQQTATLGRMVFGEPAPTVDLTDYHGRLLGVSRLHAAIHPGDNGFTLEDLGSSNGTWLNDNRVPANESVPLHSGDLIRLGQLVLLPHFQLAAAAPAAAPSEGVSEEKRRTPTRPLDVGSDIRAMTITLVGRPNRVDILPDRVVTTMSYTPDSETLPDDTPLLFAVPRFYTVHIPIKLWKKVESSLDDPSDSLIVEGTCAYDTDAGRIAIFATTVSTRQQENRRATMISRIYKRLQPSPWPRRRRSR